MDFNKNTRPHNNWASIDKEDVKGNREFTNADPPMKWHNFLIYFQLWFNAAMMLRTSMMLLTGEQYAGGANLLYAPLDDLRSVDTFIAVLYIYLAVYAILTRFSLANLKSGAPQQLIGFYAANAVVALLYLLLASSITGLSLGKFADSSTCFIIADAAVFIFINRIYYSRRAHLFTH